MASRIQIESNSDEVKVVEREEEGLPQPKKPMSPFLWNLMILVGVFIYSSYTILVHLCEVNGKIPFSSASMVFVTELMKMMLSIGMLMSGNPEWRRCKPLIASIKGKSDASSPQPLLNFVIILPFAIPAILYSMNNNLAVYIQLQMDPATYQVLGNLKILTTAFLFRLIIKRPISQLQWLALGMLMFAGIFNSFGSMQVTPVSPGIPSASVLHISVKGLIMIIAYCCISGLAGVYTEYVLKKQKEMNLHLQNTLLYIFGVTLNACFFFWQATRGDSAVLSNPLRGFTIYTWMLILTQAVGGIIMGAIMKYATNITRLFLISSAMVLTTLLSILIFGLKINAYFSASVALVIIALALYHKPTS